MTYVWLWLFAWACLAPALRADTGPATPPDPAAGTAALAATRLDPVAALRARYGNRKAWLQAFDLREMEPSSLIIFQERYAFVTLDFGIRLYDRVDYRFSRIVETAVTLDDGLFWPADPHARYYEPDATMGVVPQGDHLVVFSRTLLPPPRLFWGYPLPRPQTEFPPDVRIGTIDADGQLLPEAGLRLLQDGWTFAFDPFREHMVRINQGDAFGPPPELSPKERTIPMSRLKILDEAGRPLPGARLEMAWLPSQPEAILVMRHGDVSEAVGFTGLEERVLTRNMLLMPGQPLDIDVVQFPLQAFHADKVRLLPDGVQLIPTVPHP